jgi:hypothetical protein
MNKVVLGILILSLLTLSIAQEEKKETEKPTIEVKEMKFCTDVKERQPVGEAENFSSDVGKVWCFTVIKGAKEETEIKHCWYYKDKKMCEVPLKIRPSSSFRTYSNKRISPEQTGKWTVKVVDANGNVLKEASFTIGEEQKQQPKETPQEKK